MRKGTYTNDDIMNIWTKILSNFKEWLLYWEFPNVIVKFRGNNVTKFCCESKHFSDILQLIDGCQKAMFEYVFPIGNIHHDTSEAPDIDLWTINEVIKEDFGRFVTTCAHLKTY